MKVLLILIPAFYFSIACKRGGKMPDRSGVYVKTIAGLGKLELSLIRLSDTVYYFEHEVRKSNTADSSDNVAIGLGILKWRNDTLVYMTSGKHYYFKAFFPGAAELVVDSVDFKMPYSLSLLSGSFTRLNSAMPLRPDFLTLFQSSEKWEEGVCISDSTVRLFAYPYGGSQAMEVQLHKGAIVNSYMRVEADADNRDLFIYVVCKQKEGIAAGWMSADAFFHLIKRIYKVERYEDGTIDKWNKAEGYSLFFDSSGRLLRRENDN